MVSYDFYLNTYLGNTLSEGNFPGLAARAEEWLCKLERDYQVSPYGPDSRAMAVCAVAETMEQFRQKEHVAQATVGGVSVRYYGGAENALHRRLYQNAGVYLDIRRGVS